MGIVTKTGSLSAHPTSHDTTNYSYASVNASYPISNAYAESSNTSYGQVNWTTGSGAETYVYLRFNFSAIPEGATITSVSASAKGYVNTTTASRVTTRQMQLASGTTLKGDALTLSTSTNAQTFTTVGSWTRAELQSAGVRFYVKRGTSNTSSNYTLRMYGASMTVSYSYQETTYTITVNNSSSATASLSNTSVAEGESVDVMIDTLTNIAVTDNGVNVNNLFGQMTGGTISQVPSETFTTGFSSSSTNFYQNSSTSSTSWLEYAIGHSAESPYSTSDTNNTYAKPEGQTAWINYHFDFLDIPSIAIINSVTVKVYGARENATIDSSHVARFQCYSGSTAKGTRQDFTSTSNGAVTLTDPGTWTATELYDAQLRFEVGYYGGRMLGITWTVVYTANGYKYTITNVSTNHEIIVSNAGGSQPTIYYKLNGNWVAAVAVYKKVNGSWVLQSNLANVFDADTNYIKG